jgi:ribosomal protein L37AE/L43A
MLTRTEKSQARAASEARMAAHRATTSAAVAAGRCPDCGRPLRRNTSLTGWWQCTQFGAVGFRADATQPSCDWQGFTA